MREFGPETPVLWMDPQVPRGAGTQWILWPARAYTVLAPRVTSRPGDRLDVFQQAILRLLRANVRDDGEIASLLHLQRRLVSHIRLGLLEGHFCDDHGALTPRGTRALHEGEADDGETCMGFVFQDPGSRSLWGRFVEKLAFADVEWRKTLPVLLLGSVGKRRSVNALAVASKDGPGPQTPFAGEILAAVRRHRRAAVQGLDDPEQGSAGATPESIQRISVISEHQLPVWLATVLYTTDVDDEAAAWNVADPFGLGASPTLRGEIVRRAEDAPDLRKAIARLVKPAAGDDTRAAHARRAEAARMELAERFGPGLATAPDLEGLLVDLVVGVARAAEDQGTAARADATVRAQRALESVLRLTLSPSCDAAVAVDLVDDRDYDGEVLDAHATAIGFEPLARGMRLVHAATIRSALSRDVAAPRPLALANLLCAVADPRHVFHLTAREQPSLLRLVDDIADAGDRNAHAGGKPPRQDELELIADAAIDIAARLFALLDTTRSEIAHG